MDVEKVDENARHDERERLHASACSVVVSLFKFLWQHLEAGAPQNIVMRRPMRSRVKTQMRLESEDRQSASHAWSNSRNTHVENM